MEGLKGKRDVMQDGDDEDDGDDDESKKGGKELDATRRVRVFSKAKK